MPSKFEGVSPVNSFKFKILLGTVSQVSDFSVERLRWYFESYMLFLARCKKYLDPFRNDDECNVSFLFLQKGTLVKCQVALIFLWFFASANVARANGNSLSKEVSLFYCMLHANCSIHDRNNH